MFQLWIVGAALLLVGVPAQESADEPPARNRPARFSGAVGTFQVTMEATPTEVRADEALTLTVRITSPGPVRRPPSRPELRGLPAFDQRFHIENLPEPTGGQPENGPWEFVYRLRARDTTVAAVPSLPFVFYKPAPAGTGSSGSYQTQYARGIALKVKPAAGPPPTEGGAAPELASQVPDSVTRLAEGPAVLRRTPAWSLGALVGAAGVLVGTPLLCAGWYLAWRRLCPDAARLARQRRSQAALHALRALRAVPRQTPDEQARQAAAIVAGYLRERTDLPVATPTPHEAGAHLRRAGIAPDVTGAVSHFFQACDAARFAPSPEPAADGWATAAERLVLTLETEPCLAQPS
jgi:hypothetical protein